MYNFLDWFDWQPSNLESSNQSRITFMFFSLDQAVTKNKMSVEGFCCCYNLKREETAWPLLFPKCHVGWHLVFIIRFLVTGWSNEKNINVMRDWVEVLKLRAVPIYQEKAMKTLNVDYLWCHNSLSYLNEKLITSLHIQKFSVIGS